MLSPNNKKNINYLEIVSKTISPSTKGQKEPRIYNKKKNKRLKIKRNKASSISLNYKKSQINNLKNKKVYINDEINNIQTQAKDNNNSNQKLDINYIKTNYNLEEAYRKNHLIEDTFKNNVPQTCKATTNFKSYDFLNNINRKNNSVTFTNFNNIYYNNPIINNNIDISNNINNYLTKNNDEKIIEDDYKNFTASYRDKMVNKLKGKLSRDNLVDDSSLTELKSEKPSLSLLDNKNACMTKSNKENEFPKIKVIENNNKYNIIINQTIVKKLHRYKISKNSVQLLDKNYIKGNYRINKDHEENELYQSKNKGIKNYVGLIKKDEIKNKTLNNCLLIKDLLNNINKRNELSFTKKIHKNNNNNINNNMTIKSNPLNSSRKQSNNNKSKSKYKAREHKLNINENKTFNSLNQQYFKKHLFKGNIHKSMDIHPLNREKKIYTQRILSNLRKRKYIKKINNTVANLTNKNISLNNLINKNKKSIKSRSVNRNRDRKKISFYNRKIQIKSEENKKMLNRTMIKDRKLLASLIIKNYKRKKDLLNKTSNNLNRDCYIARKKKKIELQLTPVFSSSLIEEKISPKGKTPLGKCSRYFSDIDLTSILNKYNKSTYNKKKYECLNINDFYNYNNISKTNKFSNGKIYTSIKRKIKTKNIHKIK